MNFDDQDLITLPVAAEIVPERRHPATISRWANAGICGVRLRFLKIGGVTYTSRSALQEFFDAVTSAKQRQTGTADSSRP